MGADTLTVLFTSGSDENPYHNLLFEGLEQNDVEAIREPKSLFLPLTRAVLRNDNIDVIHLGWLYGFYMVHDFTSSSIVNTVITVARAFWFCIDLLLVRLLGTRLVWTVHNKYHHEGYYPRIEKRLNIIVADIVHTLTAKCDTAKETISQLYRVDNHAKIAVIPDGNYIDAYTNNTTRSEARDHLEIDDGFVYLYFGLIRPYKGVEQLIREFHEIKKENTELWIVGNPNNEAIGERIRSQSVKDDRIRTKLEYIPEEEVQYYMNAADVLVLPYQDILNSGSIYLGMSFGKPIIAPKIGCIPSTVATRNNLLYNPNDQKGLQSELRDVMDKELTDIGQKNLQRAKEFSWFEVGEEYKLVYTDSRKPDDIQGEAGV